MLKIPYREQRHDYDCGATALEMVLLSFGNKIPYQKIMNAANTNDSHGTANGELVMAARHFGLRVSLRRKSNLTELKKLTKTGRPVIVNYTEPENNWGHFAVVIGFDDKNIFLCDPTHGPKFKMKQTEFLRRWHGGTAVRWCAGFEVK